MDIFSVDFTANELNFIRQALDLVTVKGTDAKFLAGLQIKIENELVEIKNMLDQEELKKQEGLNQIAAQEVKKSSGKR